jgi:hypothetical protein
VTIRIQEAQAKVEAAQAELRQAEQELREAALLNRQAPSEIVALCDKLQGVRDPDVARLIQIAKPIAGRLAMALANRCGGRCDGRPCPHDDVVEMIAGLK